MTEHRSTGLRPIELHEDLEYEDDADERLQPKWYRSAQGEKSTLREKIREARHTLKKRQKERKDQAEKKGAAPV